MQNHKTKANRSVTVDPRSREFIDLWLNGGTATETQKPHDQVVDREEQEALAEQGFTKPAGVRETVVVSNNRSN